MTKVDLSDHTIQMLQKLAIPLVDSFDSVIARLAEAALVHPPDGKVVPPPPPMVTRAYLTHTRLIAASFNGEALPAPNWSNLARLAHERAFQSLGSFDALQRETIARIQQGKVKRHGYQPIDGLGFSLQGMDAYQSWKSVEHLACRLGVPVEAHFQWRNDPDAARPGQDDDLCYKP